MKDLKGRLKKVRIEVNRLEKKGEDLSFICEALEFIEKGEGTKGVAVFLAHQPEIMVFDKLRNFVADLVEDALCPEEEDEDVQEGKKFNAIPVVLEYEDENGDIKTTDEFQVHRNRRRTGEGAVIVETVFETDQGDINEDRRVRKES